MASTKKINPRLKTNNDTGFGPNANSYGGRFINKDGSFNLRREGISFLNRFSTFQRMQALPRWKFLGIILLTFFSINTLFSLAYIVTGIDDFQGILATTWWGKAKEIFYFSCETFTTVGYGRVNPLGDPANIIASVEALTGFVSFAVLTGIVYGRFSKPRPYLAFSEYALVAPYKDITALMFRFATYKDHHALTNVDIKVNIALRVDENGEATYQFYDLTLERDHVDNLPMNWTVVHPIDENSPLYGFSYDDYIQGDVELYILITGFDDVYSSPVLQRTSYTYQEMKFNAKFVPMYRESDDGKTTILEMHKLNEIIELATI
ncbi:ion channel [Chitinophagaceae bacterium MMS25-I14]